MKLESPGDPKWPSSRGPKSHQNLNWLSKQKRQTHTPNLNWGYKKNTQGSTKKGRKELMSRKPSYNINFSAPKA